VKRLKKRLNLSSSTNVPMETLWRAVRAATTRLAPVVENASAANTDRLMRRIRSMAGRFGKLAGEKFIQNPGESGWISLSSQPRREALTRRPIVRLHR
jgi:hypothetical protein